MISSKFLFIATLLFFVQFSLGQKLHLRIVGTSKNEQSILSQYQNDSLFSSRSDLNSAYDHIINKLQHEGYFLVHTLKDSIINDTIFKKTALHQHIKFAQLTLDATEETQSYIQKKKWIIPSHTIPDLLGNITQKLDQNGYNFSEVKLQQIKIKQDTLFAQLTINLKSKRHINNFVYKGYEKFPHNYRKNIERKYKNTLFSQKAITQIQSDLSVIPFITSTKKPEILFLQDSTTVYLYIQKKKANRFDGFVGLVTDDSNKATLNGYVDLELINPFHNGEKLSLYWKDNGSAQKTFRAKIGLPYLFSSPLGLKGCIELFSEDQKFQNTKLTTDVGYHINFFTEISIGYESNQSATLTNAISTIKDYSNSFITSSFIKQKNFAQKPELDNYSLHLTLGAGSRKTNSHSTSQQKLSLLLSKNFLLHPKHTICLSTENFGLRSPSVLTNELYRFGGLNSIRGFNENTLQANQVHNLMTEYRFYFSENSYIHSIVDYGFANDVTIQKSTSFKSFGLGLGIASKSGLMQLIYANGSTDTNPINISNSIVHVGYKSSF